MSPPHAPDKTIVLRFMGGGEAVFDSYHAMWLVRDSEGNVELKAHDSITKERQKWCLKLIRMFITNNGRVSKNNWSQAAGPNAPVLHTVYSALTTGLRDQLKFKGELAESISGDGYTLDEHFLVPRPPWAAQTLPGDGQHGSVELSDLAAALENYLKHPLLIIDHDDDAVSRLLSILGRLRGRNRTQITDQWVKSLKEAQDIINGKRSIVVVINPEIAEDLEVLSFVNRNRVVHRQLNYIIFSRAQWWDSSDVTINRQAIVSRCRDFYRLSKENDHQELHRRFESLLGFCLVDYTIHMLVHALRSNKLSGLTETQAEKIAANVRQFHLDVLEDGRGA